MLDCAWPAENTFLDCTDAGVHNVAQHILLKLRRSDDVL